MGRSDQFDRILEKEKPTSDPPNSGFGETNPSPIAGEVGSVDGESDSVGGGRWVGLTGSLDSPNSRGYYYTWM